MEDLDDLRTLPLLQGLSDEEMAVLRPLLHRRTLTAGTILMHVEQPGEVAYVLVRGTAKVFVDQADGTEVILALRGPGDLVGEMSLLESEVRTASVATLEPCLVLWIDRASLLRCLQTMPRLSFNLARLLARRLRLLGAQVQALVALDLAGRVARQLLALADEYGTPADAGSVVIPLRLTQSDLAALVGATRVRVNEVIVTFKQRDYIAVSREHRIIVLDRAALAALCP